MRHIEKKVAYYDKILTYIRAELREDYVRYTFKDSAGNEYTHDQIPPESCDSEEAAKLAKSFITRVEKLNAGDKVVCKTAIRQQLGGGVYRNVEKIICKTF